MYVQNQNDQKKKRVICLDTAYFAKTKNLLLKVL